jgi:glycosyltransferase involved in cell wall biosynthesis
MIYVCLPCYNAASAVGLVLWKIRMVLEEFRREYQILVVDDASTDDTTVVLEPYERALPMTLIKMGQRVGHGASLEILVREALSRSDRPRRDCLITLPADFSVTPAVLPDLIKRIESGADLVIGEVLSAPGSPAMRGVRRLASWLLRPGVQLRGLKDIVSGVYAFRLMTLRGCINDRNGPMLQADGRCADAELVARAATTARQIAALTIVDAAPDGVAQSREGALSLAVDLIRAGRKLSIPAPQTPIQRVS